jgi:hypothetical protein
MSALVEDQRVKFMLTWLVERSRSATEVQYIYAFMNIKIFFCNIHSKHQILGFNFKYKIYRLKEPIKIFLLSFHLILYTYYLAQLSD